MQNRRSYITGFLLLASLHWANIILTAILTQVVGIFIEYEFVPWFGVFMIGMEVLVGFTILYKERFLNLDSNELIKLTLTAIVLFLSSQFSYLLESHPGWCVNAIAAGCLHEIFNSRNKNEFYSQIVERMILSLSIVYFVMKKIKY